YARGKVIGVGPDGAWTWQHEFSEAVNVVQFVGESGQTATARFRLILQPLTIDPIGEDVDGTRYVFTEDVEVTGTATPDGTISVGGEPVQVASDGTSSVVLTLSAGQSHVITAQSGDGQAAQASVYVWGEPDVMELDPAVWLRQMEGMFIDADA